MGGIILVHTTSDEGAFGVPFFSPGHDSIIFTGVTEDSGALEFL